MNLTQIFWKVYAEVLANAKNKQAEIAKTERGLLQLDTGLYGKTLEMSIRKVLNPNSKFSNSVMKTGKADIFLIHKGYLIEVKTGCFVLSYSNEETDCFKYSNMIAYIPEVLENSIFEKEVKIIPKNSFITFLEDNPSLVRKDKKTSYSYMYAGNNSKNISLQSFYSEGRKRASLKNRKLIDNFLCNFPSFEEFQKTL